MNYISDALLKQLYFILSIIKYPQFIMKVLFLLLFITLLSSALQWYEQGNPQILTNLNFNKTMADTANCKFIEFFNPWCKFCRILKSIVQQHKKNVQINRSDIKFYEVNCHQSPKICMSLQIYSVPFVMIYDKQGDVKESLSGIQPKQSYLTLIKEHCGPTHKQNNQKLTNSTPQKKMQQNTKDNTVLQNIHLGHKNMTESNYKTNKQQTSMKLKQNVLKIQQGGKSDKELQNESQFVEEVGSTGVLKGVFFFGKNLDDKLSKSGSEAPIYNFQVVGNKQSQGWVYEQMKNHFSSGDGSKAMRMGEGSGYGWMIKRMLILLIVLLVAMGYYYGWCKKKSQQRPI